MRCNSPRLNPHLVNVLSNKSNIMTGFGHKDYLSCLPPRCIFSYHVFFSRIPCSVAVLILYASDSVIRMHDSVVSYLSQQMHFQMNRHVVHVVFAKGHVFQSESLSPTLPFTLAITSHSFRLHRCRHRLQGCRCSKTE